MKLRKLFQDAGVDCKPNEETAKAPVFLARLADLAERAGGEPPMPARPSTAHLDTLRSFGGVEQLAEILKQHDTLAQQAKDWSKLAELAGKRKPAWETLCTLLKHAEAMPGADELRDQADAVKSERRLLDASDPVPDIRKAAVDALRAAVTAAYAEYEKTYNEQMATLTASENWKKLKADQRNRYSPTKPSTHCRRWPSALRPTSSARWNKHRCRRGRPRPTRFPSSSPAPQWPRRSCWNLRPSASIFPAEHSRPSRKSRRGWPPQRKTSWRSSRTAQS